MKTTQSDIIQIKPLTRTVETPTDETERSDGVRFYDFGKAAFGTVELTYAPAAEARCITVRLGEALSAPGVIDREPRGSIRYGEYALELPAESTSRRLEIPPDSRNTGKGAVLMPQEIGEVLPFRYCELENPPAGLASIRRLTAHYPFNGNASHFECSDTTLNAVWDLCKYSIKATSFCGIYVDGDRERIPYEGDAYINQLCHYCTDSEYGMARATLEYLLQYPTWPTEWQMHTVLMAWEEYLYTGDASLLRERRALLHRKTLIDLAGDDGLISTEGGTCTPEFERSLGLHNERYIFKQGLRDLVDWPPGSFTEGGIGERDNHVMLPVNSVVNAFHYRALRLMEKIAQTLDGPDKTAGSTAGVATAEFYRERAEQVRGAFNAKLYDAERGVYIDGIGTDHASQHSNLFALVFDLVPMERQAGVLDFVRSRGMACSVYAAHYLLEALYRAGDDAAAFELMTARHDRGWWNMLAAGSTVTLEAWDWKYKNNLDWNHAWGAAPANSIPRFLMGVRPLEPGFRKILVAPQPGPLSAFKGKVPTPLGAVEIDFARKASASDGSYRLTVNLPGKTQTRIVLPGSGDPGARTIDNVEAGRHVFTNETIRTQSKP